MAEMLGVYISEAFEKRLVSKNSSIPAGGNMFFIKNNNTGNEDLLVGADDAKEISQSTNIRSILGVDKVDVVPQMDFHIDMFLRPLQDKNILITRFIRV